MFNSTHSVRFWEHVVPGTPDVCWEWTGHRNDAGYGELSVGGRNEFHEWKAHRLSWELHRGPIPEGLVIRHLCGNRACVNPHHLVPGTQTQNVADTVAMARVPYGSTHWNARLTPDAVRAIRSGYVDGISAKDLSETYGIASVSEVLDGLHWRRVTAHDGLQDAINARKLKNRTHSGSSHKGSKLTEAKIVEIRQRAGTETFVALALAYGVSDATISNIVNRKAWRHVP
jgi:hypothetical protein